MVIFWVTQYYATLQRQINLPNKPRVSCWGTPSCQSDTRSCQERRAFDVTVEDGIEGGSSTGGFFYGVCGCRRRRQLQPVPALPFVSAAASRHAPRGQSAEAVPHPFSIFRSPEGISLSAVFLAQKGCDRGGTREHDDVTPDFGLPGAPPRTSG